MLTVLLCWHCENPVIQYGNLLELSLTFLPVNVSIPQLVWPEFNTSCQYCWLKQADKKQWRKPHTVKGSWQPWEGKFHHAQLSALRCKFRTRQSKYLSWLSTHSPDRVHRYAMHYALIRNNACDKNKAGVRTGEVKFHKIQDFQGQTLTASSPLHQSFCHRWAGNLPEDRTQMLVEHSKNYLRMTWGPSDWPLVLWEAKFR